MPRVIPLLGLLLLACVLNSCDALWLAAYRSQGGGYENQDLRKQKVHSVIYRLDDGRWHRRYAAHPEVSAF